MSAPNTAEALKNAIVITFKKQATGEFWKQNAKTVAAIAAIVVVLGVGAAFLFAKGSKGLGSVLVGVDALVLVAGAYYVWWLWNIVSDSIKTFEAAMLKKSA